MVNTHNESGHAAPALRTSPLDASCWRATPFGQLSLLSHTRRAFAQDLEEARESRGEPTTPAAAKRRLLGLRHWEIRPHAVTSAGEEPLGQDAAVRGGVSHAAPPALHQLDRHHNIAVTRVHPPMDVLRVGGQRR